MDVLKLFESLNNISLEESKADQQMFIDAYGQEAFDRYNKIKNKIHGKWISDTTGQLFDNPKDIIQLVKQGDPQTINELISYYETAESSSEKRRKAKQGAKLILVDNNGDRLYRVTTPEAMQLYGENTTWCLAGRFPGHEDEQLYWWDYYLPRTDGGYYVIITKDGDKYCALFNSKTNRLDSIWNAVNDDGDGNSNILFSIRNDEELIGQKIREFLHIGGRSSKLMRSTNEFLASHHPRISVILDREELYKVGKAYTEFVRGLFDEYSFGDFVEILRMVWEGCSSIMNLYRLVAVNFSNIPRDMEHLKRELPENIYHICSQLKERQLRMLFAVALFNIMKNPLFGKSKWYFNSFTDNLPDYLRVNESGIQISTSRSSFREYIEIGFIDCSRYEHLTLQELGQVRRQSGLGASFPSDYTDLEVVLGEAILDDHSWKFDITHTLYEVLLDNISICIPDLFENPDVDVEQECDRLLRQYDAEIDRDEDEEVGFTIPDDEEMIDLFGF